MAVRMNMQGKHVLSMGTEDPWLEALILESGAEKITSLGTKKDMWTWGQQTFLILAASVL